jgi:hypothetical protein
MKEHLTITGNARVYHLLMSDVVDLSRKGGTADDIDGGMNYFSEFGVVWPLMVEESS